MSSDSKSVCVLVGLVLSVACGPSAGDPPPQTCGGNDPVRLFDIPGDLAIADVVAADDMFVVTQLRLADDWNIDAQFVHGVDACGETVTELDAGPNAPTQYIGAAGPWPLAAEWDESEVRWLDPTGAASQPVFPSSMGCVYEVGGGAATLGTDGTVWFHPDPTDPSVGPVPLVTGARVPEYPDVRGGDFTDCHTHASDIPQIDGDALLVMLDEGPLVRVSVPGGEQQTVIDAPIGQFTLMDDPRYILWRGGSDLHPDRDCCRLRARDRETGQDIEVGGGILPGDVGWDGHWVHENLLGLAPADQSTRFINVATGATIELPDWWHLGAVLSDTRLLLSPVGEPGTVFLDVTTGITEPSPLPVRPGWSEPTYPDGVVAFEPDGDTERGTLHFLPSGSDSAEVLSEDIHWSFQRTQTGTVVFVDHLTPDDETGDLVMLTRSGERTVLAQEVIFAIVPFHGKANERNEVLYVTRSDDGQRLWRYVLPQ